MERVRRVLVVDDDAFNRELLSAMLDSLGHEVEMAEGGVEALAKLALDIDLVLLDVMMPGMDGFEVVRRMREEQESKDVPIVIVTAMDEKADRLRAVEEGANDFISKPVDLTELRVRTNSLLKMKAAKDAVKKYQGELKETIEKRTAALRESLGNMVEAQRAAQEAHPETIHCLAAAAEYRDGVAVDHINRIGHYCVLLAKGIHLTPGQVECILHGSFMHDVGKIGIPDAILLKIGALTSEEWEVMRQHTVIGGSILEGSTSRHLQVGEVIALSHHERWDGAGYPKALAGEDIPLEGRICAVADMFDALVTRRPYKEAVSNARALEIMEEERGKHLDPQLLDLFFESMSEVVEIQRRFMTKPLDGNEGGVFEQR